METPSTAMGMRQSKKTKARPAARKKPSLPKNRENVPRRPPSTAALAPRAAP
jgi:hypothetical protein